MAYKIKNKKAKEIKSVKKTFFLKSIPSVKTKGEARTMAIDYQNWASENNLSYSELANFSGFFETLGKKFKLTEEFKENGII